MRISKIKDICQSYQEKVTGPLGVGFLDLKTGKKYTLNGEKIFPTASVCKIFTLAALYKMIDEGKASETDRIELPPDFNVGGSGVLFRLNPGLELTLYDYALLMMIISDNTAADFLYDFVGGSEGIKKNILEPLELNDTRCDLSLKKIFPSYFDIGKNIVCDGILRRSYYGNTGYTAQNTLDDVTSVNDTMKIMELIYRESIISRKACQKMLDIMKKCQTNTRIPRYLPSKTEIAHKTGTMDCFTADVGVVYTENGDFLLSLFYNGNLASEEEYNKNFKARLSDNLLADISGEIYKAYMGI